MFVSISFLTVSLVVIATPGTGAVHTIVSTLANGLRGGLLAAVANGVSLIPHVVAVITGLASLLHASAVAFEIVRYLGVAYLLYLAVQTWRGAGNLSLDVGRHSPARGTAVFREAMILNLLNPKLTLFFVAFLPQFVDPTRGPVALQILVLGSCYLLLAVINDSVYALAAGGMAGRFQCSDGSRRWTAIVTGIFYVGLAGVALLV